MKRRSLIAVLVLLILPTLACNLPLTRMTPPIDVDRAVQETLAALGTAQAVDPQIPAPEAAATQTPAVQPPAPTAGVGEVPPTMAPAGDTFQYVTQPGDTPAALAGRFGIEQELILDPMQFPPQMLLPAGQPLSIPNVLVDLQPSGVLLPDSEVVYSPSTVGFSSEEFIRQAGGFLNTYVEEVDGETLTGAQIVERVADETSINPRLLLAFLEYRSNWVFGSPANPNTTYPVGFYAGEYSGLFKELTLVARQLTIGYYGWRSGKITELEFLHRSRMRIHPELNAGTVALQYLMAVIYDPADWRKVLYDPAEFIILYQQRFGDPWQRDAAAGPLLPDHLSQPEIQLPFATGETWTMTGGPHAAWGIGSPWGGLDFAPANVEKGCTVSRFWTTAAAPGLVVRSERGMVLLDLDGDGNEQTGWVLLYMHVAQKERVPAGSWVNQDDPIGHPSCEGGFSTGTHVHISRKYNGEWMAAEGPLPFVLSGWQAWFGTRAYSGSLTRNDQVVTARVDGSRTSLIVR